jgi:hypothetical protein
MSLTTSCHQVLKELQEIEGNGSDSQVAIEDLQELKENSNEARRMLY